MGLFDKKIGPVFLKESSSAQEHVNKLTKLSNKATGDLKKEIEKQIAMANYGIVGEEKIAFELKNSGMDMYILHDIFLEHNGLSAQIDYLIITRKCTFIIECKNLIGDIEVNNSGDFIRTYEMHGKKIKEGIYSPITQNERHKNVLKEVRKTSKGNIITKALFEKYFDDTYKSIIVLANPKTVLNAKYAKKEVKDLIVRADQLINKIKEVNSKNTDSELSDKNMKEVADFFLSMDNADRSDYARKYEEIFSKMNNEEVVVENKPTEENTTKNESVELIKDEIVAKLKSFRLNQSRKENIKPYYIFNDAQMEDLVNKNPKTKEELLNVSGFGPAKVEKYGEQIIEILNK